MARPKTTNTLEGGSGNIQTGDISGTVNIGLTFEQHEASLEKALARKAADMERAHGAEKALLQKEIDELTRRLSNVPADYDERLAELAEVKAKLAVYDNQIDKDGLLAAYTALDQDDTTLAEALFTDLAVKARDRRNDAASEEAKLLFELGKLVEAKVDWAEATKRYSEAARLDPSFDHLRKAREFAWRMGAYDDALQWGEALFATARADGDEERIGEALNAHAIILMDMGRYTEAEPLLQQAQAIARNTLGAEHPDYAVSLNNLAGLLKETGRYAEAETLLQQAQAITLKLFGPEHPAYAVDLNNLAALLKETGRHAEAEPLYQRAQAITLNSFGPEHPAYALALNNFARLLTETGRYAAAEPLFREAVEIWEKALGPDHPNTKTGKANLAALLEERRKSDAQ